MTRLDYSLLPERITTDLQNQVNKVVSASSVFFRLFARRKDPDSAAHKIEIKRYDAQRKMQDLYGVRIALYFKDDIPICKKLIENHFHVVEITEDIEGLSNFSPVRLNYVCKLPDDLKNDIDGSFWSQHPIDDTFEIQIRTVFSEGWHEIEHDLRYKCKGDWDAHQEESRTLNGLLATLETCDWSIISLFDQLSYQNYLNSQWEAMIRNKLRIRIKQDPINEELKAVLNGDKRIGKDLFKMNREDFIMALASKPLVTVPKSYDNLIYIANCLNTQNEAILHITPGIIRDNTAALIERAAS